MNDEATHVNALASLLRRLPPPARKEWAQELYDLGVRIHPELATKKLIREGPAWMGNHAPQRLAGIDVDHDELLKQLAKADPAMAAKIKAAKQDPEAQERARAELAAKLPAELVETINRYAARSR